jgi:hypothetical protein
MAFFAGGLLATINGFHCGIRQGNFVVLRTLFFEEELGKLIPRSEQNPNIEQTKAQSHIIVFSMCAKLLYSPH